MKLDARAGRDMQQLHAAGLQTRRKGLFTVKTNDKDYTEQFNIIIKICRTTSTPGIQQRLKS